MAEMKKLCKKADVLAISVLYMTFMNKIQHNIAYVVIIPLKILVVNNFHNILYENRIPEIN